MKKRIFTALLILWTLVIWGHSMCPADVSSGESMWVLNLINRIISSTGVELTEHFVRKAAHFTEYAIEGALLIGCVRTCSFDCKLFCPLLAFLIAFIDESIQSFTPGRSCQFSDMLLDTSGAVVGMVVAVFLYKVCIQLKSKKKHLPT